MRWLATAAAVFLACGAWAQTRILCLGDSLTVGSGVGVVGGGYRWFLKRSLDARGFETDFVGGQTDCPGPLDDPEHEGHGGRTTRELLSGYGAWPGGPAKVAELGPDVVLVLSGRNDPDPLNFPAVLADYRALVFALCAARPQARVVVSNLVRARTVDAYEAARLSIADLAVQQAVYEAGLLGYRAQFVDALRESRLGFADFSDGVHLSDSGYAKLARVWFRAVYRKSVAGPLLPGTPGG